MKKSIGLLLVVMLIFATGTSVFAGENENGGKEKAQNSKIEQVDMQKSFKAELNALKKEVAKAKGAFEAQKEALLAQYGELVAAGDTTGAEALLIQIDALDGEISLLQNQMKQIINERYMIVKTQYSNEELAQFENAAALIEQMYADATALDAGTIIIKDNLIKFDAPAYIKGGRTIIPVRTITEELGATVVYDPVLRNVTITKDSIEIILTINSTKVLVNGVEQQLDASTEITCGRTYVPLRFIAETFGLTVSFDEETGTIDIDEEEPDETEIEIPGTTPEDETEANDPE